MKILLIDAFDSFVFVIYQYLLQLGHDVEVVRTDEIPRLLSQGIDADLVVLGPGPGHPQDSGYVELIKAYVLEKPFFGICLGHQAIGLAFGASVERTTPIHGQIHSIEHDAKGCFTSIPSPMQATRYHSLILENEMLPDCLEVTALDNGIIMGIRHKSLKIESVQFHPESIGTENGLSLLNNISKLYTL